MIRPLALALALLASVPAVHAAEPVYSPTGFDAADLGEPQGYPIPARSRDLVRGNTVGFYSHYDRVVQTKTVARAGEPSLFKRAAPEITLDYTYGQPRTLQDYIKRYPITGLLVARDDTILFEHYQYGRADSDRFLSQSMAKTIIGMLVGIAVSEGAIHSIDDMASVYVPELAGSAYGATPLRALLHMSSGVKYHETYEPGDDNAKLGQALFSRDAPGAVAAVRQFDTREAPPGTRWYYSGAETEVLGLVVSHAVHTTLSAYLSTHIWQKLGMESDAAWATDATGQEVAYCCFVATLRDWARLGLLMANDGAWHGQQIVPKQWVIDATTVAPADAYLAPGRFGRALGYGYQVWLVPGGHRAFAFVGLHGQRILVDPVSKLVMVQTAVFQQNGPPAETMTVWNALEAEYGGSAADYTAK